MKLKNSLLSLIDSSLKAAAKNISANTYTIRLWSDFPADLVQVYPSLEGAIYNSKNRDRTLYYDIENTINCFTEKLELFSQAIMPFLKRTPN